MVTTRVKTGQASLYDRARTGSKPLLATEAVLAAYDTQLYLWIALRVLALAMQARQESTPHCLLGE